MLIPRRTKFRKQHRPHRTGHSKGGNYLSLTAPFTAHSRKQLDDLYRELSALPQVSYLI